MLLRSRRPSYANKLWLKPCPGIVHFNSVNIESSVGLDRIDLPTRRAKRYLTAMDELTTSIVGVDFPNEDRSKSNRRMECMLCAPGDAVELRLEPTNPFENNAVAIQRARHAVGLRQRRASAVDRQADERRRSDRHLSSDARKWCLHPDPVRRWRAYPARPGPRCSEAPASSPGRPAQRPVCDPHALYPDDDGPEWAA
jgi:hypothetical protein